MSESRQLFVFLGAPGSGKGSVAEMCEQRPDWSCFSTGNACRSHVASGTDIGRKVCSIIKDGRLVPDKLINAMMLEWLDGSGADARHVVLDGYPRNVEQAQYLNDKLCSLELPTDLHVVRFAVSDEIIVNRLSNRLICENPACQRPYSLISGSGCEPTPGGLCGDCGSELVQRNDDREVVVRDRLKRYHANERGLLDFYAKAGQTITQLDCNKPLVSVFKDFMTSVGVSSS